MKKQIFLTVMFFLTGLTSVFAEGTDIPIPDLREALFPYLNMVSGYHLLIYGAGVIAITLGISLILFTSIKRLPAHVSMLRVSETIYQTCRTYLIQQGKFLIVLFLIVSSGLVLYLSFLEDNGIPFGVKILFALGSNIVGMLGSYFVAWYGMRLNNYANSRTAFAALKAHPWSVVQIPLKAGISIGTLLISLELIVMIMMLLFIPRSITAVCFVGFAIGESLGASALRIAGGIFTKIADIGSDLMKILFKVKEDDPRNPGVIADCAGDNAGDSVGPTSDGFETYGVTGVALINFITLTVLYFGNEMSIPHLDGKLITWIFFMRYLLDVFCGISYFINQMISSRKYGKNDFNFEQPLSRLILITVMGRVVFLFSLSYLLLGDLPENLWFKLSSIISLGTLGALIIPEITKKFSSSNSIVVKEIVKSSDKGGAALNVLSGTVAGYFSSHYTLIYVAISMIVASILANGLTSIMPYWCAAIFAFGLMAYGSLSMGPVTIAVDSYGPVTDNAQSIFELSGIERIPRIKEEIKRDFGFTPDFVKGKYLLEKNDSAGNTFKASTKPVLITTAVTGSTTMIFAIILLLKSINLINLDLTNPMVIIGFVVGVAMTYWFSGATIQAVIAGAYRTIDYIKSHLDLTKDEADIEDSKEVVRICTVYAQKGMVNIFMVLIASNICFAFFDPNFFISFLLSLTVCGFGQAVYTANMGGSLDNAKKIVEVELGMKNTPLHEATVVGDTNGDPNKDTTSVGYNPYIKFSSLFGLLAIEIAVKLILKWTDASTTGVYYYTWHHYVISAVFFAITIIFVWRSYYKMRIDDKDSPLKKKNNDEDEETYSIESYKLNGKPKKQVLEAEIMNLTVKAA